MVSQEKFISRIVWIVDPMNSCLGSGLDYEISDRDLDTIKTLGNPPVITKLLSCKQALIIKSAYRPPLKIASERLKGKVMPFMDEDKVAVAVMAILYIISNDETVGVEHKESFKKHFGMYRDDLLSRRKFNVPDFFSRVLLYTIDVNNKEGSSCIGEITETFIKKATNDSWVGAKWDANTQVVTLMPTAEKMLFDHVKAISGPNLSLLEIQQERADVDIGWTGVEKHSLFPSSYGFMGLSLQTKRMVYDKMKQYVKLLHELTECLKAGKKSTENHVEPWPIFPNNRMRGIYQQLMDLYVEIDALCTGSKCPSSEQDQEEPC